MSQTFCAQWSAEPCSLGFLLHVVKRESQSGGQVARYSSKFFGCTAFDQTDQVREARRVY
jgi:hypothetical protein